MRWTPDKEATLAWLKRVEDVDLWDDKEFHTLVRLGLELTGMTDAAFAELVNVSRPSVTRWKRGQSVPHSGIRINIYGLLRKEVQKTDLRSMCRTWLDTEGDDKEFASIVTAYLNTWMDSGRKLADEFEAAISTVSRWADGFSRPRPRMKRAVVEWIMDVASR